MANILFITNSLSFGGAAKMLSFVAKQLDARGHRVCIVNRKATADTSGYQRHIPETILVKTTSSSSKVKQIREITKIAKGFGADVIIGFTSFPNAFAKVVGLILGKPSIMSERGDPERTGLGKSFKDKILLALINHSAGGVFQTEGARAFYGKGLQRRGIVIPNPIFAEGEIPSISYEEREKSVVSVARFENTQKRYDVMLDAFKLFSQQYDAYYLKLYGSGPDEELVRRWVDERGLTEKVKFMGLTTKSMQDTCRDGMFIITSDYEGISNALLEAMAVGLPCVSTDHSPGGGRLLIQDHHNGLLVPTGDAAAASQAMCEFASNQELAEMCGKNAREVLDRFAPERIIDMWEQYIRKICNKT